MSRDWRLRLDDIRDCCRKILRYTSQVSKEDFLADAMLYDAVVRNLEIIGEAAKHVPVHVRESMASIEWKRIAGMRDWTAHGYFKLDSAILWNVIEAKIPALLAELEKSAGPPQ